MQMNTNKMQEEIQQFVRTGSRIRDLQGLFNQGSATGPPPMSVRGMRNTPPPGGMRNTLNVTPPGDLRTALNTSPPTVKHLGRNDRVAVNGSVKVGGKSFNTSSSARIGNKTTPDKKLNQNGITTPMANEKDQNGHAPATEPTNKASVVSIERKFDEPALVKDHIPVNNNNNEFHEENDSQKEKEIEKEHLNTDKSEENGDNQCENIHSNENGLFQSVFGNSLRKSFKNKNQLKNLNNEINKIHSNNEDKKNSISEDEQNSFNKDKYEEKVKSVKKLRTRIKKSEGYVGFASLPGQVCRKAVKKGFEFTLMVVGESGLGKSTLVNSIFLTDIYSSQFPGPIPSVPKTLNVETHKVMLEEDDVKLSLTVVDTPGFGDAVDNTGCWKPITNFVDQQYEKFLEAETKVNRVELPDTRVHVCLYFIAPSGHGLKPLDIEFMSRLHEKVNIIPVIGKADACTTEELQVFKLKILAQIADSNIQIYSLPEGEEDGDDWMRKRMPFAVVGSNAVIEGDEGKRLRARKYPWGTVIIENENHCDFLPLRDLLLAHHMQDLKDVTNYVHYENFRCKRLTEMFSKEGRIVIPNKNPLAVLEDDAKEHMKKVEKTTEDMEEVFERKVEEKEKILRKSEGDMEERLQEFREKLEEQKNELEKEREMFLKEKKNWQNTSSATMLNLRRKQSLESLLDGKKKRYGLGMMTFKIGRTKNDDY